MLYIEDHGGGCCGRRHLFEFRYNFPNMEEYNRVRNLLDDYIYCDFYEDEGEEESSIQVFDLCVEVTLTQDQAFNTPHKPWSSSLKDWDNPKFKNKTWDQVLREDFGFKRVYAFRNPNTDNEVYVYLYSSNELDNNF